MLSGISLPQSYKLGRTPNRRWRSLVLVVYVLIVPDSASWLFPIPGVTLPFYWITVVALITGIDKTSWVLVMAGVLKEIDCYLSSDLRKQLLLLFYKNRSNDRVMENEHVKECRMKATLDLLEMKVENGKNPSVGHEPNQSDSYLLRSEVLKLPSSVLGYFVNDECHLVPLEGDALVMDTVKELMKEMSRVPEARESAGASQSQTPSVVVSARFKVSDSGDLRGQIGSRRKPTDNDPDVLFRTQQNLALWRPVKYRRFVPGDAFECRIPLLYPYEDNEMAGQTSSGPRQEDYTSSLLSSLAPTPANPTRVEPAKQPTLEEIIQALMLKVHVIRFNKLVGCVRERFHDPHQVTNAAVLHHVQKVAVLVRGCEPPPPGSETERESLKPRILEALIQVDARLLKLMWPTDKDARPEEMLFASKVAGSECGVISEETHRLRDLVLETCEKQPFFRVKDLYDRLEEMGVPKPSRKILCSVLKHYCVYKHNRYYLRHTLFDS
ncbi:unnamed protein product [Dicrocoelium dendriticum]|nr:unnamed protein product [Dicrocoelium dendriticum]